MTSLLEIARKNRQAKVNGQVWDIEINITGKRAILRRTVRVNAHWRNGKYYVSGRRYVEIRRPADSVADMV